MRLRRQLLATCVAYSLVLATRQLAMHKCLAGCSAFRINFLPATMVWKLVLPASLSTIASEMKRSTSPDSNVTRTDTCTGKQVAQASVLCPVAKAATISVPCLIDSVKGGHTCNFQSNDKMAAENSLMWDVHSCCSSATTADSDCARMHVKA